MAKQAEEAKKHTEEIDQLLKIEEEIRDALKRGRIDKIYNQGPKSARKIGLQGLDKTNFLENVPIYENKKKNETLKQSFLKQPTKTNLKSA